MRENARAEWLRIGLGLLDGLGRLSLLLGSLAVAVVTLTGADLVPVWLGLLGASVFGWIVGRVYP